MADAADTDDTRTGRPPHEPTDHTRGQVTAFAIAGYTQEQIGAHLGISHVTLRKHYARELEFAAMEAMGQAVGGLMGAVKDREAWAICFYLKTRGKKLGFTERVEHTGADGAPLVPTDLSGLTDDELEILDRARRLVARLAAETPNGTGDRPQTH